VNVMTMQPTIYWTFQGKKLSIDEWSALTGIPYQTLYYRHEVRRFPLDQVLTERDCRKHRKPPPRPPGIITTSDGRCGTYDDWEAWTGIRKSLLKQRKHRKWTDDEIVGLVPRAAGGKQGATAEN
jgi:hypothetical protein